MVSAFFDLGFEVILATLAVVSSVRPMYELLTLYSSRCTSRATRVGKTAEQVHSDRLCAEYDIVREVDANCFSRLFDVVRGWLFIKDLLLGARKSG